MTDKLHHSSKSKMWPLDMFEQAEIGDSQPESEPTDQLASELREITALYNIGVVLNSSLNPKEVVWAVYKETGRLVDTSYFALAIVDHRQNELRFMLVFEQDQSLTPFSAQLTDSPALTGTVVESRSPILIDDLSKRDQTFELVQEYPDKKVISWLGVPITNPLITNDIAQGAIVIWNPEASVFSDHDLWLLSAIGTQASIAIRNARLYESSQRRAAEMARLKDIAQRQADEMRFLNEVARSLSSTLSLDKVLTSIMEQVDEKLEVEAGSLLLTDPLTGDLVFQIALGEKASEVKPFRVPKGQGIAGRVAETGKPLVIADAKNDERHFKAVDRKTQFTTRNMLSVPLILHNHVIGVLQVLNKKDGDFQERDVNLLSSISSFAAIAIENARLYESLEAEHTRTIQAEQEARKQLAAELHDGPTQLVAAVMMNLDFAEKALEKDPSLLPKTIKEMQELASRASHQMRTLLFELRPLVLETQGLGAALQVFLDRRQKDAGDRTRLSLVIKTDNPSGDVSRQDGKIEATIFAIVQETVNNAIKHADAEEIVVKLKETPEGISVIIQDNGVGFDVAAVMSSYETRGSLGMLSIRERAETIGGECSIESAPGQGTKISIYLPSERAEQEKRIKRTLTGRLAMSSERPRLRRR